MNHDCSALIQRAAGGDAAAFALLVEQHYMLIYKIAYKWCGRREDAEDIAQEVCVKLPEKLAGYRGEAAFASWLYRLTINAAKDYGRKRRKAIVREIPFTDGFDAACGDAAADDKLIAAQAYAQIHALPEPIRDAVLLVFGEEMSHRQAAEVLGCAETTISWRIFRARKLLNSLADETGESRKQAYAG